MRWNETWTFSRQVSRYSQWSFSRLQCKMSSGRLIWVSCYTDCFFPTGLLSPTWTGFFKDPCCPLSHKDKELLRENGYWRKIKRWAWRLYLEREKLVRRRTEELKRDDRNKAKMTKREKMRKDKNEGGTRRRWKAREREEEKLHM